MNTILYMTTTANGAIATADHETPWSDESWQSFATLVAQTGNIIIGAKTYEIMKAGEEFERIENPFTVVVSSHVQDDADNIVVVSSPEEALRVVEEQGYQTALVAGGSMLNASFMEKGLIDEVYLDIEPLLFGNGIPLFAPAAFHAQLELLETNSLSTDTVQLHYKVVR